MKKKQLSNQANKTTDGRREDILEN